MAGRIHTISVPDAWSRIEVPDTAAVWIAPQEHRGFRPNVTVVGSEGDPLRGEALAEEVAVAVVGALDDAALIDVEVAADDDVRLVVAHRFGSHRVTLLQRVLAHEAGTVTLSVSVPDLWLHELREQWEAPLHTFAATEEAP